MNATASPITNKAATLSAVDLRKAVTPVTMQSDVDMNEEAKKKENTKLIVWAVLILVAGFLTAKYTRVGKLF